MQETNLRELISFIKTKNFTEARKWIRNNLDTDVNVLYNQFYDIASELCAKNSVPGLIVLIADYQFKNAFSANPEINFAAFVAHCMQDLEFE